MVGLCLVEWITAHHHNTQNRNITAGESKVPCRSPSVLPQCEAMGFLLYLLSATLCPYNRRLNRSWCCHKAITHFKRCSGCVRVSNGGMEGKIDKRKCRREETKREEERERLNRSMCSRISPTMAPAVHLCRLLQGSHWCFLLTASSKAVMELS